jgi:DNA-binding transcriptional regulator YiaG
VSPDDLKQARGKWALSQTKMAKVLGVHLRTYQGWEWGQFPMPLVAVYALDGLTKKKIKERLTDA